jgi:phage-related protein
MDISELVSYGLVKPIEFVGTSLDDLRGFPVGARRECGYQLDRVQQGFDPVDFKPMPTVGNGVREVRVREQGGAFRVICVANVADRVYVLHCFQKRTQQTARTDLELATRRYKQIVPAVQDRAGERT